MHSNHVITIPVSLAKERLDKALALSLPDISRTRARQLIESGCISNGSSTIIDATYRVKPGEQYSITIPKAAPSSMQAASIPVDVVYEDDVLLVVNKPAGLTVHPGAGNHQDTLANALLSHCMGQLSGIGGVESPGIVHRIDKDTS
jgi:23S rRNA pseudouridine1911/1915/1917 synthase